MEAAKTFSIVAKQFVNQQEILWLGKLQSTDKWVTSSLQIETGT